MNVLVFAPHPDDEILGCGGTIAMHVAAGDELYVCIVTRGMPPVYPEQPEDKQLPHSLYSEIQAAHTRIGVRKTYFLGFPAVMLESVPRYELNRKISELIAETEPEVIYIPHFGDMQKDHLLTAEAVMVAVRPKIQHLVRSVYAYETLSETEWNIPHSRNTFIPNVYQDITPFLELKLDVMRCYQSQLSPFPNPRSLNAVRALAMLRGSTMGVKAAEAFMLIRQYRSL